MYAADDAKNFSPAVAPHTGAPAITVPMGFTAEGEVLHMTLAMCGSAWQHVISLATQTERDTEW
jgi:Asp-tRNA(Asn)/Glu-tRNA(Gln) amidotransferase A subunit family amidase